ncbi:MAG: hypothetical protein ACOC85_03045 [Thermoplasmatota archaeon]
MGKRLVVVFLITVLFFSSFLYLPASAVDNTLSDPANVNHLIEIESTPTISPGDKDNLSLALSNPYEIDIKNVSLTLEIYRLASDEGDFDIEDIEEPPIFDSSEDIIVSIKFEELEPSDSEPIYFDIKTTDKTPRGVYYVRLELEFYYPTGSTNAVMRSKGHYSAEDWDIATQEPGGSDIPHYVGNINLTYLGVDGIIEDTSFSVRNEVPKWPQYLLFVSTIFFAILAFFFYWKEEYR